MLRLGTKQVCVKQLTADLTDCVSIFVTLNKRNLYKKGYTVMRKFNITVNGKTYEVDVEEIGGVASAPVAYTSPAPAPAASAPAAAPAAAPAKAPAAPAPAGSGKPVPAPMPGTVVSIKVNVGDKVTKDTLVAVLEAMKMENEIFAGMDGTVTGVVASAGASVNSGDTLVTIG